jgi:hypothetical protein
MCLQTAGPGLEFGRIFEWKVFFVVLAHGTFAAPAVNADLLTLFGDAYARLVDWPCIGRLRSRGLGSRAAAPSGARALGRERVLDCRLPRNDDRIGASRLPRAFSAMAMGTRNDHGAGFVALSENIPQVRCTKPLANQPRILRDS